MFHGTVVPLEAPTLCLLFRLPSLPDFSQYTRYHGGTWISSVPVQGRDDRMGGGLSFRCFFRDEHGVGSREAPTSASRLACSPSPAAPWCCATRFFALL